MKRKKIYYFWFNCWSTADREMVESTNKRKIQQMRRSFLTGSYAGKIRSYYRTFETLADSFK